MDSEFITYVLFSKAYNKIYVGFTSNLIVRFSSHNKLGKGYTSKYRPWEVVYIDVFVTKKDAMLREKELKSFRGREFIRNVVLK
ncbi:MAG: endonuclease [Flavobacteria bacterium RIFCSPLOWO2_12_FULL_35_11]|nr:MAG: endonuclease [Flavobacteria bacterium RIFCSPLOWO2_12_FULL_35_11]